MPNRVWLGRPFHSPLVSEAPVEEPDALVVVLRADRPRAGNCRPAAVRDDLLIALDGILQRLDHLLAAQRHLSGRRSLRASGRRRSSLAAVRGSSEPLKPGKSLPPLLLRECRRSKCGQGQCGRAAEDSARPIDQVRSSTSALRLTPMPAFSFKLRLRCRSQPAACGRQTGAANACPCGASPSARLYTYECKDMAKQRRFTNR